MIASFTTLFMTGYAATIAYSAWRFVQTDNPLWFIVAAGMVLVALGRAAYVNE